MKTTTSITALLILASAAVAGAQTSQPTKIFIGINGGFQTRTQSITTSASLPIYGETATLATNQEIGSGGIFDVSAGYRVWSNFGVALGYSQFSNTGSIAATASVPSPVFFNSPAVTTTTLSNAKRTDHNIYLVAVYFMPVTEKIELSLSAGPSGTNVRQALVNSSTFSVAPGTQTPSVTVGTESGRAYGVNIGIDGTYLFTKNLGGGIFIRYNGSSVDLPSVNGLKVGGFQMGFGGRVRF